MSDQQDKQDIEIDGGVIGSAVGDGAKVNADNIAGRDVHDNRTYTALTRWFEITATKN